MHMEKEDESLPEALQDMLAQHHLEMMSKLDDWLMTLESKLDDWQLDFTRPLRLVRYRCGGREWVRTVVEAPAPSKTPSEPAAWLV